MAGNSTVHIGTWESHIVPDKSFQQAKEARRKYGDMAGGPGHSRGVDGVMSIESQESGTLEGPGSKMQRDEQRMPYAEMDMGIFISNESARQGEIRSQKKSKITRWKLQKATSDISSEKGVDATTIEEIPSV